MKLKNVLVLAFFILTLIPFIIVSFLLYNSGFSLSKESYTRNLIESITVQVDYIAQTIENNMISDYRFVKRSYALSSSDSVSKDDLLVAIQSYLESSEDKIAVCLLLDQDNVPIYTIGEKAVLDNVSTQIPDSLKSTKQTIVEFDLGQGVYSLGIVTPARNKDGVYMGSLISVYDKSYVFKIISSYYKIADTSTYICRDNGEIVNFNLLLSQEQNAAVEQSLKELTFDSEGTIDLRVGDTPVSGYYKNILNSPWHLVGFMDDHLIYSFINQFILVYIIIIFIVFIAGLILSFYFSRKVVEPINRLIQAMDGYQNNLNNYELQYYEKNGYFETQYLQTKFVDLMKTIMLVQHNFEGIYQLYQSSDMGDTNIDIDVRKQTVHSNKPVFQQLMDEISVPEGACIVERFINCFCEKDQAVLQEMFENMRDEHLSVTRETEIYTPYLNQKWFHSLVVPMYTNERLSRLFIQLRDISGFKRQQFESNEQVQKDALTGLYNRTGFTLCASHALQAQTHQQLHGLLFLDMDYFKLVNDNFGHKAGDDLLRSVAETLLDTIGTNGITSRFGGDEFAVFLPNTSAEGILAVKETLNQRLVYPFSTDTFSFVVSASIGVATWDSTSPQTLEDFLQQADTAMYQAKRVLKQGK